MVKFDLRLINNLVDQLFEIRDQLSARDAEKLLKDLSQASFGREKWLRERNTAQWDLTENTSKVDLPSSKQVFARMFTFGSGRKPKPPK